ncbi:MAG: hypothetical protein ACWA5P_08430 [bacterium]
MKKIVIVFALSLMVLPLMAQRNINPDRIKAQKVAFITERLDLTSKEAQQFWPIYNAFEEETEGIRQGDLKDVRQAIKNGNLSENEAKELLDKLMSAENRIHQAKLDLVQDLKAIIPAQKIIALKTAEDAFNRKLIEVLKKRREQFQQRMKNRN